MLGFNKDEEMIFCNDLSCGFQISQYRMERLVTQMNNKPVDYGDNFSALQRLGETPPEAEERMQYLDI